MIFIPWKKHGLKKQDSIPVSYTHLDVYKRQAVLNETGGREVPIHDRLSAHQAYILALYRHRPELICRMKAIIDRYACLLYTSRCV